MSLGRRQLFIYWRVAGTDLQPALQAVRDWQIALAAQWPKLRCGLYQRSDPPAGDTTVMESYAIESAQPHAGIDDALRRHIEQAGDAKLAPWLASARKVEAFDRCDG